MRLDGKKYWVNPHMIESMESTPDLTLTMLSGRKIIVKNSPEDLIEKIIGPHLGSSGRHAPHRG